MDNREIEYLLDDTAKKCGVVGAQLALFDGQALREFTTGYRNRELNLPVTRDTLFQIGSTTKVFNAVLALSLVEAGEVQLDIPVRNYISEFRLADVDAGQKITLRQLLSMSGGLDNGPYYDFGRGDDALGRYVEVLSGVPHIFVPGSAFGYSNASSVVAGYVAAKVTDTTWERCLSERVWKPLGLKRSALFAEELLEHPVALGYRGNPTGSTIERSHVWSYPRSQAPSGSLTCCSAGDLVRLAVMLLNGGMSMEGNRVLSDDHVDLMHTPQVRLPTKQIADDWCIGPFRKEWDSLAIYGHSGTNFSGSSMLLWCPERKVAIATVVNVASQGYPFADAIFDQVFPRLFGINKPAAITPLNARPIASDPYPYEGRFEAFGMSCTIEAERGQFKLSSETSLSAERGAKQCDLISLGSGRFLPCDPDVSGNRNWDIAFWGSDRNRRATNMLLGIFPLRRVG